MNRIITNIAILLIMAIIAFMTASGYRIITLNKDVKKLEANLSALTRLVTIQDSLLIEAIKEGCK